MGSLLLDVVVMNATDTNTLYSGTIGSDTSRAFNFGGNRFEFTEFGGLQTEFTYTSQTAATPEPSTLILLGTGFATLYGFARRSIKLS